LINDANIFEWSVCFLGPQNTPYAGGLFNAVMNFPQEFPDLPPALKFTSRIYHPNVYPDGRVCISVLHSPGDDPLSGERAIERWSPQRPIDSVLSQVLVLLGEPNADSPANVEAAKIFREDKDEYVKRVKKCVEATLEF